jgi:hypothetical protein
MYLAEIHGKIPSHFERLEDLLTSNVFSFFKYTNRQFFLKKYLKLLDIEVTSAEAEEADFRFWPRFDDDNTEPDLVIVAGSHYLLFEAKYFSDFGVEIGNRKAQLIREIEGGLIEARNEGKLFQMIAITADHYYRTNRFSIIPQKYLHLFKWTNWQRVTSFLHNTLEGNSKISSTDRTFASDLYSLLVKKNLRDYIGTQIFLNLQMDLDTRETVFFDYKTASFRGDFIGFLNSLQFDKKINPRYMKIIEKDDQKFFSALEETIHLKELDGNIFFEG